jgi:hypothetical protein
MLVGFINKYVSVEELFPSRRKILMVFKLDKVEKFANVADCQKKKGKKIEIGVK